MSIKRKHTSSLKSRIYRNSNTHPNTHCHRHTCYPHSHPNPYLNPYASAYTYTYGQLLCCFHGFGHFVW
jgi:hypothetical protein